MGKIEKKESKVQEFLIVCLCLLVGAAIIAGIITALVVFVYPLGKNLEVIPVFIIAVVILIAFIVWSTYNKIRKNKEEKKKAE